MQTVPSDVRITAWLGAPPLLASPSDLVIALVDDVLELVHGYGVTTASTGEPRKYVLDDRGRSHLAQSLRERRVEDVISATPVQFPTGPPAAAGSASAAVTLGSREYSNAAAMIDISVSPAAGESPRDIAARLVDFVGRWFEPIEAYSGFVSVMWSVAGHMHGDSPGATSLEAIRQVARLSTRPSLTRYLRGAFWGNAIGADLCARLGGRDRVLHDGPAMIKQPLGTGVWLQLSAAPPAPPGPLADLEAFLAPLLDWSSQVLGPLNGEVKRVSPASASAHLSEQTGTETSETVRPMRAHRRKTTNIRWLAPSGDTATGLNVYLAEEATPKQRAQLQEAVSDWYGVGAGGGFGGVGFHMLQGPSIDGRTLRWYVDLGSADERRAISALARRLAGIASVDVEQLVVGVETVR